jgi:hypothetical protein
MTKLAEHHRAELVPTGEPVLPVLGLWIPGEGEKDSGANVKTIPGRRRTVIPGRRRTVIPG